VDHYVKAFDLVARVERLINPLMPPDEEAVRLLLGMAKVHALLAIEERLQRIEKTIPGSILI